MKTSLKQHLLLLLIILPATPFTCFNSAILPPSRTPHTVRITTGGYHRFILFSSQGGDDGSDARDANTQKIETPKRTLYEVLQSDPTATREELKKQYITLARTLHPDASSGNTDKNGTPLHDGEDLPQFTEIVAAWKTLSNPKERRRYDRTLQAEAFTEDVVRASKKAAPHVKKAFERLAVPFFRRTTATTSAALSAARKDLNRTNLGDALASAVKAGQYAGKVIDRLELLEKSQELSTRNREETMRARELKDELSFVSSKRICLSIQMPNSELSSSDARRYLNSLNITDELTIIDTMLLRHTVQDEIMSLEEIEVKYYNKLDERHEVERDYERKRRALELAEKDVKTALLAEEMARKAYEAAQQAVLSAKQTSLDYSTQLSIAEPIRKQTNNEAEKLSLTLSRQQEKVRKALRKKESITNATSTLLTSIHNSDINNDSQELARYSDLATMKEEERYLMAECARVEDRAMRLKSRARKLEERARILKEEEVRKKRMYESG